MKKSGLNLQDLIMISTGQVIGAGIVTLIGPAIAVTGISAWLAYGLAVFVGFFSIVPFIFLSSTLVLKGGEYSVILDMIGTKTAGIFSVIYITQMIALSLLGTSMGFYLNSIFPNLNAQFVAIVSVSFFFILNLLGINVLAKVQTAGNIILFLMLLILFILGVLELGPSTFDFTSPDFFTDGAGGVLSAISLYAYSTFGQYMVINFSKYAKNPKRDIPLSIIITTIIMFFVYVGIALVSSGVLPISQTADQPLTVIAEYLMSRALYPLFIIGAPLMAIATTLNSTYAARATPILKAAEDGWFPEIFKKCNKKQVPYVIMFFIYLIAVVPILFDLSIQVITNNIVVFTNLIMMLSSIAIIRLPTLYPKEWRKSFLHIPDVLFYIVMFLAFIAQSYLVYLSLLSFSVTMAIINLSFVAICVLFALWRYYSGKVNIKEKITFE